MTDQNPWIRCPQPGEPETAELRLPRIAERVWVWCDASAPPRSVGIARLDGFGRWKAVDVRGEPAGRTIRVHAWAPMPEPPEPPDGVA